MKKAFLHVGLSSFLTCAIVVLLATTNIASGQYAGTEKDPLQWDTKPHSIISTEVIMSVIPVSGDQDVEYKFECISGDAASSDWQPSNEYRVSGLQPESGYTFSARVRETGSGNDLLPATSGVSVTTRGIKNNGHKRFVPEIDQALANGDIELIPIRETGNKDNRINIIIMNRWEEGRSDHYNTPEMRDTFLEHVRHAYSTFIPGDERAIAPMPEYRDFFNLYAVWWPGVPEHGGEKGMRPADYDEIRDRLFLPWHEEGKGWVSIFAMFNSPAGGGGAARIIEERVGNVMLQGRGTHTFIHEFGHTAFGLPDEYTSAGVWGRGGKGSNTTYDYIKENVQWKAWIEPGTEIPTPYTVENHDKVGVFEGATHRMHHIYRSTARGCLMGAGSAFGSRSGLCPICVQRSVSRIYMWADPFDSTFPVRKELTVNNTDPVRFKIDVIKPLHDTQSLFWYLNDRLIAEGVSELDVSFGKLETYELECRLVDETQFVRPDRPFVDYPTASVKWTIISNQGGDSGNKLDIELTTTKPLPGSDEGSIITSVKGGTPPYLFEWNDYVKTKDRSNLSPGQYKIKVFDAEYRQAEKEIVLSYPENFSPEIISSEKNGRWDLTIAGVDGEGVTYLWSDGARGPERSALSDGNYYCTITDTNGNQTTREITLKSTEKPFSVKIDERIPSTGNQNNGSICLSAEGGRKPYTFHWSDGKTTQSPCRNFLVPGNYSVTIHDENQSVVELNFVIEKADAFFVEGLQFTSSRNNKIKVSNPDKDYTYLWYTHDIPHYVPRFPDGHYNGSCITEQGEVYKAKATIVENRGGVFIQDTDRNDFGRWIALTIYTNGEDQLPVEFSIDTQQDERYSEILQIEDQKTSSIEYDDNFRYDTEKVDITWNGIVEDGFIRLTENGFLNSTLELSYSSYYPGEQGPVSKGVEFAPSEPANYFVAAQNNVTKAISLNRQGVAVTQKTGQRIARPMNPAEVKSSNLIMWMDGDDLSADGKPDGRQLRRGSANNGRSKAGDIDFHFFNYFPNAQNGKPALSWSTLWVQTLSQAVNNYQTIVMVRKESDYSEAGTGPYRELNPLIGVGPYGDNLFHDEIASHTLNGKVRINSETIDPLDFPMPKDFYIASYQFDSALDIPFRVTDGHWEGEVAEILVFDSVLSEKELEGVEAYLHQKWLSGVEY